MHGLSNFSPEKITQSYVGVDEDARCRARNGPAVALGHVVLLRSVSGRGSHLDSSFPAKPLDIVRDLVTPFLCTLSPRDMIIVLNEIRRCRSRWLFYKSGRPLSTSLGDL